MKEKVIRLQYAADDLWSRILDTQEDIETTGKYLELWNSVDFSQERAAKISEEIKELKKEEEMLIRSYSIIIDKISELCMLYVKSAKDLEQ
jgi:hypothetical protein